MKLFKTLHFQESLVMKKEKTEKNRERKQQQLQGI